MLNEADHIASEEFSGLLRAAALVAQEKVRDLTGDEQAELLSWIEQHPSHQLWKDRFSDASYLSSMLSAYSQSQSLTHTALEQFHYQYLPQPQLVRTAHRVHFLKTAWVRYAAAIIILFGIGAYLWSTTQKEKPLITDSKPVPVKNDILPGSHRAVLTLSKGQKVVLDSAGSATIQDGTLSIENNDGQLIYKNGTMVAMNTMATPKGGQYQLTLADGTRVWLNAASSVTYPTAFTGKTREVTISGEAYFEVSRNPKQPFIVKTPKEDITVLGTAFNVNAYADEPAMKTSLVEGIVKIENQVLKPGYAYINGKVVTTNIEQDVAWKTGAFAFDKTDINVVLRQIARWYDVEIVNRDGPLPIRITGSMGRDLTLQEVINGLQKLGVNTKLEGRKLITYQ